MSTPLAHGHLERSHGVRIYWEQFGRGAVPAVFLHGGPGSGITSFYRSFFDPAINSVVAFDQRGCGRSTPSAVDDPPSLAHNNTQALIDDIEALREHLGIEQWIVAGLSWGSTLGLAYAEVHPERVIGLALGAVTTTSRSEVEWITQDLRRVFPDEWSQLARAAAPRSSERVVDALYRAVTSADSEERDRAAIAWGRWENTHGSLDPNFSPDTRWNDPRKRLELATLVLHYWSHHGFLGEAGILENIARIAMVPGVMVHGRRDLSSSMSVPFDLHQAWTASRLVQVPDEGHGGPQTVRLLREAIRTMST
ncbi:alpha/beta fold hydrolase [Microbacterium sp. NPDC058345]|uniref:alpha/beta fold hydrolase n=1 Tax=Microbacterium sp. NPDC058345 TaxID=3346455 RepID=UPI0036596046